jgi:hypothetical protein
MSGQLSGGQLGHEDEHALVRIAIIQGPELDLRALGRSNHP